jgi:GTP cyclohydrolase II
LLKTEYAHNTNEYAHIETNTRIELGRKKQRIKVGTVMLIKLQIKPILILKNKNSEGDFASFQIYQIGS